MLFVLCKGDTPLLLDVKTAAAYTTRQAAEAKLATVESDFDLDDASDVTIREFKLS